MPLVRWDEYGKMLTAIASGEWRVIGWGAGASFRAFHCSSLLHHDYLVDSDPEKWGTRVHGYEVKSPGAIASEDPERTVVIIYNFRDHGPEIMRSLERIGPFRAMMKFHPAHMKLLVDRLQLVQERGLVRKPRATSRDAILVQGPVTPGVTELALRQYALHYPEAVLILSSWTNTPSEHVRRLEPLCDQVVLTEPIEFPGTFNRNAQLMSTRAGLSAAAKLGANKVLKTRTNALVAGEDVLRSSAALQANFPIRARGTLRLRNRLISIERYTCRFVPYHVSDLLVYGDLEDVENYFGAPLDLRSPLKPSIYDINIGELVRTMHLSEIYITRHFLERIGWCVQDTIQDYWNALRDLFIIVDERWFGHFFPRYEVCSPDDAFGMIQANALVDFQFWFSLYTQTIDTADCRGITLDAIRMFDTVQHP